jgi:site-specific DNA-adenine methylase
MSTIDELKKIKRIRSPIPYLGSKFKELFKIYENEPEAFDHFVDVFGGGGSCSLNYSKRGKSVHYNDIYGPLVEMFTMLKDKEQAEKMEQRLRSIRPDKTNHAGLCSGEFGTIERLFYVVRCTINMCPHHPGLYAPRFLRGTTQRTRDILPPSVHLSDYADNLKNWDISQMHYMDILKQYQNNETAFLYCDPPYVSKTTKQYTTTFEVVDLMNIFNFMKDPSTKCRVMLNVDYTGWTRETFAEMVKTCYPVVYGRHTKMNIYEKYHLMVCNY